MYLLQVESGKWYHGVLYIKQFRFFCLWGHAPQVRGERLPVRLRVSGPVLQGPLLSPVPSRWGNSPQMACQPWQGSRMGSSLKWPGLQPPLWPSVLPEAWQRPKETRPVPGRLPNQETWSWTGKCSSAIQVSLHSKVVFFSTLWQFSNFLIVASNCPKLRLEWCRENMYAVPS